MRIHLTNQKFKSLLPAEPGLKAHCRRVSAIAVAIGRSMRLPVRSMPLLEQAALLHHTPGCILDGAALRRLAVEIQGACAPSRADGGELPDALAGVLRSFHAFPARTGERAEQTLAEILGLSNWLDEQLEARSLDPASYGPVWANLEPLKGMFRSEIWSAATQSFPGAVPAGKWELPIQADIAREFMHLMQRDGAWDTADLIRLASQDPAIAGRLIQAANSPLFGHRVRIRSVQQAVVYLGIDASKRILAGLVARSLFGSSRSQSELWKHSLWVAHFLENAAKSKGFMSPEEALLAGLVHDVGRLAITKHRMMPAHIQFAQQEGPAVWAETLLFGVDHSEIGARILESWRFPESIVTAVRLHHRPAETDSVAASAVYAAEFWSETDEDLPSLRQLKAALARLGCTLDGLAEFEKSDGSLSALLAVA